jgi:hypothetical protein
MKNETPLAADAARVGGEREVLAEHGVALLLAELLMRAGLRVDQQGVFHRGLLVERLLSL